MREIYFKSFDNKNIFLRVWDNVSKPKAVIQIFHGMCEHSKRFNDMAIFLNKYGYIVYADDHRVHGKTSQKDKLGIYDGKNIFYDTVNDEIFLSKKIKEKYQNLPLYIFGHSYGSFIAQSYITRCDIYDKVILCGSALLKSRFDIFFGRFLANFIYYFIGKNYKPKWIINEIIKNFNRKVGNGSWLCSNFYKIEDFFNDPLCNYVCSTKFYKNFICSFKQTYSHKWSKMINKNKPIFIISGINDPVGSMGKSVVNLYNYYMNLGIANIKYKLYSNARHEIMRDVCEKEMLKDVICFLKK